jgi:hypothetical protein
MKKKATPSRREFLRTAAYSLAGVTAAFSLDRVLDAHVSKSAKTLGTNESNNFLSHKSLDDYVSSIVKMDSINPERTIYVIAQVHNSEYPEMELAERYIRRAMTMKSQRSIYHILEELYDAKKVGLLMVEGLPKEEGGVTSLSLGEKIESRVGRTFNNLTRDRLIDTTLAEEDIRGAQIFLASYGGLHYGGFEDSNRASLEDFTKVQSIDTPVEVREKLLAEMLARKKLRSVNSIKYGVEQSDALVRSGQINNKNIAIVIGSLHLEDYLAIREELKSYELYLIVPKGIPKEYLGSYAQP